MSFARVEYIFREGTKEAKKLILNRKVEDIVDLFELAKAFADIQPNSYKQVEIADLKETDPEKIIIENYKLAIEMFKDVQKYELPSDDPIDMAFFNKIKIKAKKFQNDLMQAIQILDATPEKSSELKVDVSDPSSTENESLSSSSLQEFTTPELILDSPRSLILGPRDSPRFQFASSPKGLLQPWVSFDPYAEDKETNQKSLGLMVENKPVLAREILDLAKAIFEKNPAKFNFKFEKDISDQDRFMLVKRLCELAHERFDQDLQDELNAAQAQEQAESKFKKDTALNESAASIKGYQPNASIDMKATSDETKSQRSSQTSRINLQIGMYELDKKLSEIKTRTEKFNPAKIFLVPETETAKTKVLKQADNFLAEVDKYWNLANQQLGNLISLSKSHSREIFSAKGDFFELADKMFKSDEPLAEFPRIILVNDQEHKKLTPQDFFQLAHAILDNKIFYKGAPMILNYDDNTWAKKSVRCYFALYFLTEIDHYAKLFPDFLDKKNELITEVLKLQKMTAKFSQQFDEQSKLQQKLAELEVKRKQFDDIVMYVNFLHEEQTRIKKQLAMVEDLSPKDQESLEEDLQNSELELFEFHKKYQFPKLEKQAQLNLQEIQKLSQKLKNLNIPLPKIKEANKLEQSIMKLFNDMAKTLTQTAEANDATAKNKNRSPKY